MYNVKIIITNQNPVKNTTAETFFATRHFEILFSILEKNCNTFCNT